MDNIISRSQDSGEGYIAKGNVQKRTAQNNWITAIHNASRRLCCSSADRLLEKEVDINNQDRGMKMRKHKASSHDAAKDLEIWKIREADLNRQDSSGNTRAHLAIIRRRTPELKVLLSHGVNINLQNSEGQTPLHAACLGHYIDLEVIDLLLQNNAAINIRDKIRKTPLHDACSAGAVEVVQKLLIHGANVNAQDCFLMTPSHMASSNSNASVLSVLLSYGAHVNLQNTEGLTPLHTSCFGRNRNLEVIDLLLKHADIDKKSNLGNTALHIAVLQPNRVYEKLLDRGARIDVKNNDNETPYDLCMSTVKQEVRMKKTALEEHIIKLKTAGFIVDICLYKEEDVNENTKQLCLQELGKMKMVKINNHISLYNFIFATKNLGYLRNPEIIEELEEQIYSVDLMKDFPMYGHILKNTYENAKLRVDLLNKAFSSFSSERRNPIWSKMLPELVKYKILEYLTNEDLKSLIESGQEL